MFLQESITSASAPAASVAPAAVIDSGSTAWMLSSSALVLLMVPGLALFYGGMVRKKNVLSTIAHSFAAMGIIGVQWVLIGYCLAFGKSFHGLIGWDVKSLGLAGIEFTQTFADKHIPELVFVMFQGKFAIITPALISGAIAERMKFSTYLVFILVWSTFVYCPLAHWTWASDGWLFKLGVLDFAGGTVVHISSGASAIVLAKVLGKRRNIALGSIQPHSLPLTLLGAGLLWFGWFGFNAGSAVAVEMPVSGFAAALAFTTTQAAAAAAALTWMIIEWRDLGKPTGLGFATGCVAGLVAITPGAGHVKPVFALLIGVVASLVCYRAVQMKKRFGYDDALDAFGVHGVGGAVGAILTGVFCFTPALGLVYGSVAQFGKQALGVFVAALFAGTATYVLAKVLDKIMGLRVTEEQESEGLDLALHGEQGYHS